MTSRPATPDSDSSSAAELGPVEQLLHECLLCPDTEQTAALERVCADHPEHAATLRHRFALLAEAGMVEPTTSAATSENLPRDFGEYRLLRRLGRGGMGVVYLAEQPRLGRRIALKLIGPEQLDVPEVRARFWREAHAASRLDHPHICPVFDIGEVEGTPYIAMRHLEGETLAQRIGQTRQAGGSGALELPVVEETTSGTDHGSGRREVFRVAALVEKVSRALHAAHETGLVHRDVKPGNVMVGTDGEPVILDFGLARDDSQQTITRSGEALGTPAYMAPEQISGSHGQIDRRTDVYALGVLLYECLTLRAPFSGPNRESLYRRILSGAVTPAHRDNRHVPRDLEVVLAKALDREPGRRYSTALELAEDLARVRHFQPIRARRTGPVLRTRRWMQRNPVARTILGSLAVGLVVTGVLLWETLRSRERAVIKGLALEASRVRKESPELAFRLAREALRMAATPVDPVVLEVLQEAMGELCTVAVTRKEDLAGGRPRWLRYSPDGSLLAAANNGGAVCVYRPGPDSLEFLFRRDGMDYEQAFDFAPDGDEMAIGYGRLVHRIDARGREIGTALDPGEDTGGALCIRYSPSGQKILVTYRSGTARLWDRSTCDSLLLDNGQDVPCGLCAFSPDGATLCTAGGIFVQFMEDQRVGGLWIWNADGSPRGKHQVLWCNGSIAALQTGADRLVAASFDGSVGVFSGAGEPIAIQRFRGDQIPTVALDPSAQRIVLGSARGRVRVLDRDGTLLPDASWRVPDGHVITAARYHPDGRRIVTAGWSQYVQIWEDGVERQLLRGHLHGVMDVAVSPDGERIASVSWDGQLRLWRTEPLGNSVWDAQVGAVAQVARSGDERWVLWVGSDGRVRLADPGRKKVHSFDVVAGLPVLAAFTDDDATACVVYEDGRLLRLRLDGEPRCDPAVELGLEYPIADAVLQPGGGLFFALRTGLGTFDLQDPEATPVIWHNLGPVDPKEHYRGIAVAADGRTLLAVRENDLAEVWDLKRQVRLQELRCAPEPGAAALTADGRFGVIGTGGAAQLWDRATGTLHDLDGHQGAVQWVGFSPDERTVLSASGDDTLRLWDRQSRRLLQVLRGHRGSVVAAAFWDNARILSASRDGTIRWWWLDSKELGELVESLPVPRLTDAESERYAELLSGQ